MRLTELHNWDVTPTEAIRLQHVLASRVQTSGTLRLADIHFIAGVDVSMTKFDPVFTAGVIVCRADTMEVIESAAVQTTGSFPYIPGLLSFREIPALSQALAKIKNQPDVVLVDGQGIAHPRRLGIASHLGLLLDLPTIGVGKSPLVGGKRNPGPKVGDQMPLHDRGEAVGRIVRTKLRANPLYLSVGHKVSLDIAVEIVQHCLRGYRLPEPTRLAHEYVNKVRLANNSTR